MKNPKLVKTTKSEAASLTRKVKAYWRKMETSWSALGRLVDQCLKKRVPEALGLTAEQWMEQTIPGSSRRAWRALRSIRALQGVPEEKLSQITEGNAQALTRLPEKERKDPAWINKAVNLPNEDFKEEVETLREKKTGIRRQEFITVHLSMPREVFDKWEAAVQKMARVCCIDLLGNEGRRLLVYERIAALVDGISEEALKNATEGA